MNIQELAEKIVEALRDHSGNETAQAYDVAYILRSVTPEEGDDVLILAALENASRLHDREGLQHRDYHKSAAYRVVAEKFHLRTLQEKGMREALALALELLEELRAAYSYSAEIHSCVAKESRLQAREWLNRYETVNRAHKALGWVK